MCIPFLFFFAAVSLAPMLPRPGPQNAAYTDGQKMLLLVLLKTRSDVFRSSGSPRRLSSGQGGHAQQPQRPVDFKAM